MTWWLKCCHSEATATRDAANLYRRHCSFLQCTKVFYWAQSCSFIQEQIHPPLGEKGRPAEWGSRWCRWVRKCCFSSLMCCLTLGKYLCLCFFSYVISGAVLTYLKSTVAFAVVNMWGVAIQLTLRSDWKIFSIQSITFLLKKKTHPSQTFPLPSQDFLLKFLMCKSYIST